jgi:hypothetical protein
MVMGQGPINPTWINQFKSSTILMWINWIYRKSRSNSSVNLLCPFEALSHYLCTPTQTWSSKPFLQYNSAPLRLWVTTSAHQPKLGPESLFCSTTLHQEQHSRSPSIACLSILHIKRQTCSEDLQSTRPNMIFHSIIAKFSLPGEYDFPICHANEDGDGGISRRTGINGRTWILHHGWTWGRRPWGWQRRTHLHHRSIANGIHWSEPKLLDINCHEPWITGPEPKRRGLANDGNHTPRVGIWY